jgi:putative peptidyl-prolyl cis-trans isomerase
MKNPLKIAPVAMLVLLQGASLSSWEMFDRVVAVVNNRAIVESEVADQFGRLLKLKKIPAKKHSYEKSRILDKYIEDAIFMQEADEQSIIVSDEKVKNYIEKMMGRMNIDSIDDFKKRIESKEKISFEDFKDEIRKSMIKELVMSIAIGVSPPSQKEIETWYGNNKKKLGYEVSVKHIMMRPKGKSMKEEKRVNAELEGLMAQVRGGESFEDLAKKHSEDSATKKDGGSMGWIYIAQQDQIFAGSIDMMLREGKKLKVIRSSYAYHLVKIIGRRDVTLDAVRDMVQNLLYQQRMGEQFKKWVVQKKKESEIKIYMEEYVRI